MNFLKKWMLSFVLFGLSLPALSAELPRWTDTDRHLEWIYLGTSELAAPDVCKSQGANWRSLSDINMPTVIASLRELTYESSLSASLFSITQVHSSTPDGQTKISVPTTVFWVPSQDTRDARAQEYNRRAIKYKDIGGRVCGEFTNCNSARSFFELADLYKNLASEVESGKQGVTLALHEEDVYVAYDNGKWYQVKEHSWIMDVLASSYLANVVCFRVL